MFIVFKKRNKVILNKKYKAGRNKVMFVKYPIVPSFDSPLQSLVTGVAPLGTLSPDVARNISRSAAHNVAYIVFTYY